MSAAGEAKPRVSALRASSTAWRPATLPAPAALRALGEGGGGRDAATVTLRFVGKREGQTLNALYRGKEYATNVLAFVYDESRADRRRHRAVRPGRARRGPRRRARRSPTTARTSSSMACCTCRATTTTPSALRARWRRARRRSSPRSACPIPMPPLDERPPRSLRSLPPEGAHSALRAAAAGAEMNDERGDKPVKPTLLERLSAFLTREPEDRDELLELLHGAFEHKLLDADALSMIEGVLQVSEMTVRDIMIPRAQMDVVSIDDDAGRIPAARARDQALAVSR